jgi:hypothetical protein
MNPDNACREGDDVPDASPIRVILVGREFATTGDGPGRQGRWPSGSAISMHGPNSLARLAEHLIAAGHDAGQEMTLYRGGVAIGTTTVGHAAKAFT